jgi:hypothetical protein
VSAIASRISVTVGTVAKAFSIRVLFELTFPKAVLRASPVPSLAVVPILTSVRLTLADLLLIGTISL